MSETDSKHIDAEHIKKRQRLDELDSSAVVFYEFNEQEIVIYAVHKILKNGAAACDLIVT